MPPPAAPVLYKTVDVGGGVPYPSNAAKGMGTIIWSYRGKQENAASETWWITFGYVTHFLVWLGAVGTAAAALILSLMDKDEGEELNFAGEFLIAYFSLITPLVVVILLHAFNYDQTDTSKPYFSKATSFLLLHMAIVAVLGVILIAQTYSLTERCLTQYDKDAGYEACESSSGNSNSTCVETCMIGKINYVEVDSTQMWLITSAFVCTGVGISMVKRNLDIMTRND